MIGGIVAPVIRRFSFSSEILEHELVEFIKNVIFCNIPWHFCPCVVFSDFCIETKSMVKLIHIEFYKIFIKKVFYRFAGSQIYSFTDLQVCVDPHFVLGDLPLRRQGVGGLLLPLFLQPASHVGVV